MNAGEDQRNSLDRTRTADSACYTLEVAVLPIIFGLLIGAILWRFLGAWAVVVAVAAFWLAYRFLNRPVKKN
jgi:predicted Co/Zn/Cd cation transporter (cation efflux family)